MKKSQENPSENCKSNDYFSNIMRSLSSKDKLDESDNINRVYNEILNNESNSYWSKLEDDLLLAYVRNHKPTNWRKVAEYIKTKNSQQCAYRYSKLVGNSQKKAWSKEEDLRLVDLVEVYGTNNWDIIAGYIKRDAKEIQVRFREKLDPRIKRSKFSKEEDELLLSLHKELGNKWGEIAQRMENRSQMMIKNRYYSYLRKKLLIDKYRNENESKVSENKEITDCISNDIIKHNSLNEDDDNNLLENSLKTLSLSLENPSENMCLIDSIFLKIFSFYKGKNRRIDYFYPCHDKFTERMIILNSELDQQLNMINNQYILLKSEIGKLINKSESNEIRMYILRLIELVISLIKLAKMKVKLNSIVR